MKPHNDQAMIIRTVSPNGLLHVNRSFSSELGLAAEDLSALPLLEWIHPNDRPRLKAALTAGAGQVHARHRTNDGDWACFEWRVTSEDDGVVALGLPRQPNKTELRSSAPSPMTPTMPETLRAMALIVEAKNPGTRCSILLVDDSRERVTVGAGPSLPAAYNEAVEGLQIGPAVGSCGTAAFWNVPVIVENIAEDPLWRDLRGAAAIAGVCACWSHPINDTDGNVLGAMAMYTDVPMTPTRSQLDGLEIAARMVGLAVERGRLEDQLRQAAKMEALGVLAGGIAHDFNNMLATVLGNADLAMTKLPETHEATPMLQAIATASLGAADLCTQMLTYAGRGAMSPETIDCISLVEELGGMLKVALSKKATLEYDMSEELLGVVADRSQLRQVIMNLITNASEAIGDNEGRVVLSVNSRVYSRPELERRVSTSGMEPGEYVVLRVSDTGLGMTAQLQSRIFDPFYSTKSAGRGLGLAAVRGVIVRHGGAIMLKSRPGVGTTFTLLLPRTPITHEEPLPSPAEPAACPVAHVLVVDDEPAVRKVTADILKRAGYSVTCAQDGEEALDLFSLNDESIDCVLLDLSMPKLDGVEVFERLRAIREDLPVVLSSGFTEQQVIDRFEGLGLSGVVQKPAPMHVLLDKIAGALA